MGSTGMGGARVLIAEDDLLIAKHLADVIEASGGTPLGPVAECADAHVLAQAIPVDLALVDLRLKDGDAWAVLTHLAMSHVPVIALSGSDRAALPPQLRKLPYLQKPFTDADLIDLALMAMRPNVRLS